MIFRIFGFIGLLLAIVASGYYYNLHYREARSFSKTPYKELQGLKATFISKLQKTQMRVIPENDQDGIFKRREEVVLIKSFVKKIEKEIFQRQVSLVLGLAALFFLIPYFLWKFFHLIRLIRFGKNIRVKGVYHRGKIDVQAPKVLYIDKDELHHRVLHGFTDQKESENFLRTDGFLLCPECSTVVKADQIGSVQEVIFMEEPPLGAPKDYRNQIGTTWEAKPKDQYLCQKCGRKLIRSARG